MYELAEPPDAEQNNRWSNRTASARPGFKLALAIVVGLAPRPSRSFRSGCWSTTASRSRSEATRSITAGWGAPQAMTGPVLVIPYRATATETVVENGQSVTRSREVTRELTLAPEAVELSTDVRPEVRKRSIYEAVVYDAARRRHGALRLPARPRPHGRRSGADGPEPRRAALRRSAIRAGSAPIRASPPTAGRCACSPAAEAAAAAASSPGSMRRGLTGQADRGRFRLRLPRQCSR